MASNNEGYLSHSWGLLTRDEGWIKPLLVLAAAQLVPVIGPIGVNGYVLEWARLTAWGVDSSPKQKGVDIGGCIKSGARALAVSLGFGLALCKTIVQAHGGTITLTDNQPHGSVFTFSLPAEEVPGDG